MNPYLEVAGRLAVASLMGLAVGMEREWSGHASGPTARFAGARTFLLLGLLGGICGWLAQTTTWIAPLLLGGGAAITVAAYVMAVRRTNDVDGTTETAALLILGLGTVAGLGHLAMASAASALVMLTLAEKTRIHGFIARVGQEEMRAALYFAVLALVVLPILPEGPFGPLGGIRPRALWAVVLVFCALNFAGYLARRAVGEARGYAVTGLLGGLVSSTGVTFAFARQSREETALSRALGLGVLAACTMLIPRLLAVTLVLDLTLTPRLALYLAPPFGIGVLLVAVGLFRTVEAPGPPPAHRAENPLRLLSAMKMALAFQLVLIAVNGARAVFGAPGVLGSAAVLGLTDMDALTYSMIALARDGGIATLATKAIAIGVLSNTLLKLAVSLVMGAVPFRRSAAGGLGLMALGSALGIWIAG